MDSNQFIDKHFFFNHMQNQKCNVDLSWPQFLTMVFYFWFGIPKELHLSQLSHMTFSCTSTLWPPEVRKSHSLFMLLQHAAKDNSLNFVISLILTFDVKMFSIISPEILVTLPKSWNTLIKNSGLLLIMQLIWNLLNFTLSLWPLDGVVGNYIIIKINCVCLDLNF